MVALMEAGHGSGGFSTITTLQRRCW